MLIVYVDDYTLAGPTSHLKEGWTLIRKGIITGEPEPIGRYLGCKHRVMEALMPAGGNPAHGCIPEPPPKSKTYKPLSEDDKVRAIQLQQRSETKKRKIDYERSSTPSGKMTKIRIMQYDMKQLFMGCVKVYLTLASKTNQFCVNRLLHLTLQMTIRNMMKTMNLRVNYSPLQQKSS